MIKLFDEIGTPVNILTDNGGEFQGRVDVGLEEEKVGHLRTSSHAPWSNGVCERTNRELLKQLRILTDESGCSWTDELARACEIVNDRRREKLEIRGVAEDYNIGDLVWVWADRSSSDDKLEARWRGPARIEQLLAGGDSFRVRFDSSGRTATVVRRELKRYHRTFEPTLRVSERPMRQILNEMGFIDEDMKWIESESESRDTPGSWSGGRLIIQNELQQLPEDVDKIIEVSR